MGPDTALAVLTIDLGAIVANWRLLSARHPSGPTGAVVKANAYGLGAAPVAAALYAAGCRLFFVATADEALALRPVIPDATLVVLGALIPGTEADLAAHAILPALGSLAEIATWTSLARRLERALPAWLHVDTGMARLGLEARELDRLAADHALLAGIDLGAIMSHLASSEVPSDPLNARQRDRFVACLARLPPAKTSLVNSSGIFLDFGFDYARPGAALYGINPTPGRPNPMRPVVELRARVLTVREIPPGSSVGYNATWSTGLPARIATVGVGYADGWHRGHSNNSVAFFDAAPVPLVGRVSMDLSTFNVTGQPDIEPGSWLELLGPHRSVDDAGRAGGTFGYEVLTALGRRYHRVYRPA